MEGGLHINSLISTVILGAVVISLIYHIILYIFTRDHLVFYYILFLLFFGVYTGYVSGIYKILFGEAFHLFFRRFLAEGSQMIYFFFYNFFILKAINLDRKKHKLLYALWNITLHRPKVILPHHFKIVNHEKNVC